MRSGDSRGLLRLEGDSHVEPGKHVDQSIDAEQLHAPPFEITDPGLRYSKKFGRTDLCEPALFQKLIQRDHEVGADQ